ncbi:MAG: PaaI family thioesterase [Candidatus Eremiobacteraeota bacterium]|nr:PaaI family thioesterase [Candidatus Eremiobacteraeota bacterium]MBV8280644.1 PaaI family thioesterase [Candidatus Eremiobacteraeota bacterium]
MPARGIDPKTIPERFRRLLTDNPVVDHMEMEVVSYGDGESVLRFPYKKEFAQYQGTVQGGIQAAYADAAMAVAVTSLLPEGGDAVTTDLHIRFLRTIMSGPVIARARITHRGKTLLVGEATVEREDGTVCARVTATNMIVTPRGT